MIRRLMRIQYASDLHLEFFDKTPFPPILKPVAPVLVLAGDVGRPDMRSYRDLMHYCSRNWDATFVVAGNHELYNGEALRHSAQMRLEMCETICGSWPNVHFMNRSRVDRDGITFLGATLWTDMVGFEDAALRSRYNDFNRIGISQDTLRPLELSDIRGWHQIDREWLAAELKKVANPTVVITHHLPTMAMISPRFASSPFNAAFAATDCEELVKPPVVAWIAGHTHVGMTAPLPYGIVGLTNPRGYPGEQVTGYCREMFVDIPVTEDKVVPPTLAILGAAGDPNVDEEEVDWH
jgi:hypothetical protein